MSKLFEWGRRLCREVELAAPPVVQQVVMPRFHEAKEITRMALKPYLTLDQWQGAGQGGPLVVSYAGLGYSTSFLKSLLFTSEPHEKKVDQIPVWSHNEWLEAVPSDVVIIEASKHLIQTLPRQGAFVLPLRVQHLVGVQKSWEEIRSNFRESARKNDVQRIQKFGYEYELSRRPEDLEMFYQTMYVPTMEERHGELASIPPFENLQPYFRRGFLLLIKREGRVVSAGLCTSQRKAVLIAMSGVVNADHQLRREGAVAAIHYSLIHWANQTGYEVVNLGACWPFLSNGIFQSKRKWGTTAVIPPREHKRIWIKVQRDTPAVRRFLKENPTVVVSPGGALQGLVFTDDSVSVTAQARAACDKKYATPGLDGLLIRSIEELVGEAKKDNQRERH